MPRIGVLVFIASGPNANLEAFRRILHALGWVEGQNIGIDYRWAADKLDRLPSLAEELVRRKVDLIVAWSTPAVQAAKSATRTIPVVMGYPADPVGSGFVANLARASQRLRDALVQVLEFCEDRTIGDLAHDRSGIAI